MIGSKGAASEQVGDLPSRLVIFCRPKFQTEFLKTPLDTRCGSATIKPNLQNQNSGAVWPDPLLAGSRSDRDQEVCTVARPVAKELTQREVEVMHVFWSRGPSTVAEIRDQLAGSGRDLAYTTVATLVRILADKGFLKQTTNERPFQYCPVRSFEDVSRSLLGDMVDRVFRGSREQLLLRLLEERSLSAKERAMLKSILEGGALPTDNKNRCPNNP